VLHKLTQLHNLPTVYFLLLNFLWTRLCIDAHVIVYRHSRPSVCPASPRY